MGREPGKRLQGVQGIDTTFGLLLTQQQLTSVHVLPEPKKGKIRIIGSQVEKKKIGERAPLPMFSFAFYSLSNHLQHLPASPVFVPLKRKTFIRVRHPAVSRRGKFLSKLRNISCPKALRVNIKKISSQAAQYGSPWPQGSIVQLNEASLN